MSEQQHTGVLAKAVQGDRRLPRRGPRLMEIVALIGACRHLVAQLDAHRVGAAIFLCLVALVVVGVIVVALAATLRAALAARVEIGDARVQRGGEHRATIRGPSAPL